MEGKNYVNYALIGLLVVAAFVIGSLYTKNKALEQGKTLGVKEEAQKLPNPSPSKVDIKINSDDPILGSKNAKVTLVVFSDFLCPYCAALSGANKQMVSAMQQRDSSWQAPFPLIKKEYVDSGKVRIVWKDTPFHGEPAIVAHEAGRCANDQGKFWDFHNLIFSKAGESENPYTKDDFKKMVSGLGLNMNDFNSCLDSDKYATKIKDSLSYAQGIGINGTPTSFINGKIISGAASYPQFKTVIDEELKK